MRRTATWVLPFICLLAFGVGTVPAQAQSERAAGPTPPRLAFMNGEVSFWRPGSEDWAPAQVNTALAAGDSGNQIDDKAQHRGDCDGAEEIALGTRVTRHGM